MQRLLSVLHTIDDDYDDDDDDDGDGAALQAEFGTAYNGRQRRMLSLIIMTTMIKLMIVLSIYLYDVIDCRCEN